MKDFHQPHQVWHGWTISRDELGRGSFGVVYRAWQERSPSQPERLAAVKHIRVPSDAAMEEIGGYDDSAIRAMAQSQRVKVENELHTMMAIKGLPHIVSLEDHRITERLDHRPGFELFLRMELLTPLPEYVHDRNGGCMTPDEVAQLGCQIADALAVLHTKGLIHRDIKPGNLFVDGSGSFKLGDFGTARMLDSAGNATTRVGSESYMAPEVDDLKGRYDHTVDIYSLGMVMYRLLNRNFLPFTDMEHREVGQGRAKRLAGMPVPPPMDCPPDLAGIVLKCMAFSPEHRYQRAEELSQALRQWLMTHMEEFAPADDTMSSISRRREAPRASLSDDPPSLRDPEVISDALWNGTGPRGTDPWFVPREDRRG